MITKGDKHKIVTIVQDHLGRINRHASLSKKDWRTFRDCQLLHTCVALDVLECMDYETFVIQWIDILDMSPFEYLEMFQRLQDTLLGICRDGVVPSTLVDRVTTSPEFSPFQGWVQAIICNSHDEGCFFRSLYQLLAFPLRLDLSGLAKADFDGFLQVNSERVWYSPSESLKWFAKRVIDDRFCRLVLQHYQPQHGPGAISTLEQGILNSKWLSPTMKDRDLDMTDVNLAFNLFAGNRNVHQGFLDLFHQTPVKVIDVPKSWKKRRIIAIESSTAMYNQQGLRAGLYKAFRRDPLLSQFIDLEHPETNGNLARLGSLNRDYGTIDLSNASDSVGYEFVKDLFQETALWKYLKVHRSCEFRVSGEAVQSGIFATMGNAICFPIETLVFTLLVLEARDLVGCQKPFAVYGDDIVASNATCEALLDSLEGYGFTPNLSKTFTSVECPFRESCGYEWYEGGLVTPIRISRKFAGLPLRCQHSQVLALVDLANSAYREGYYTLYRFLVHYTMRLGITLPFSRDGRFGFVNWNYRACNSAPAFFDAATQRCAVLADRVTVKTKTRRRNQTLALREWLAATNGRDGKIEDPVITSTSSELVGFTWKKCAYKYIFSE